MNTSARQHLLEFLLADGGSADSAARALSDSDLWKDALAEAKSWKVIPALFDRVRARRVAWKAADSALLKREFLEAYRHSAFRASRAAAAISGLGEAGIRVAAFKGIASIARLYGDVRLRTIHDADLLLAHRDLDRALPCLERHGFRRRGPETLEQYQRFVADSPGFAGNHALTVYDPQGAEIDLHWELVGSGLLARDAMARATGANLLGVSIPVVDAVDGFLLTVHHAVRENLAIENMCRDLLDTRLWLEHLRAAGRLEAAIAAAASSPCKVPALAMMTLAGQYDPTAAARDGAALLSGLATPAERRSAATLGELFRYQFQHGKFRKDVLYLVHSRPWRQIARGLARDWAGYTKSMQTMEQNLGSAQPWHSRIAGLARSLPGVRGLRLARELACIKFAGELRHGAE